MTWTKLGDEFSDEARDLSDAAFRTHVEALCWSNRRGLDLTIPKRDLKRFAEADDADTAVKNLIASGWWQDCGDSWFIGMRFADWQQESVVVNKRREGTALRVRRHRMHEADDHSICLPRNCPARRSEDSGNALHDALPHALPGTGRDGSVRDGSENSFLRATPSLKSEGGRGAGEGGVGGEERAFPEQCARHQDGDHDDPCGACGRARTAHRERQAAEQAARAREEALLPVQTCTVHWLPLPCGGCAADAKAGEPMNPPPRQKPMEVPQ